MKLFKIVSLLLLFSFTLGVGLIAFTPTNVQAGNAPLCKLECGYRFVCYTSGSCAYDEVMFSKCFQAQGLSLYCIEPYDCGCVDIGCVSSCGE